MKNDPDKKTASGKKPYSKPLLRECGKVKDITQGLSQPKGGTIPDAAITRRR